MELKGRLKLVADKVPVCDRICDIGTDHAYVPIYLIQNKKCKSAIAADVGKGPLAAAGKSINSYGLQESIETRLGDGLEPIKEGECQGIVIAGMGGVLMGEILQRDLNKAVRADFLVLQAMNSHEMLRGWLYEKGFQILDEELVSEGDKVYDVMVAKWTGQQEQPEPVYRYIGKKLIEKKDPLLERYAAKIIRRLDKVIHGIKQENGPEKLLGAHKRLRDQILKLKEGL